MSTTYTLTDNFTGTTGAAWDSGKWTLNWSTGAVTIQSNRGRTSFANANNAYAYGKSVVTFASGVNYDFTVTVNRQTSTSTTQYYAGFADAVTSTASGVYSFNNQLMLRWDNVTGAINLLQRSAGGAVTTTSTGLTIAAATDTKIRMQRDGTTINVKAWTGATEPGTWGYTVTGTSFPATTTNFYLGIHAPNSGSGMSGQVDWDDANAGTYAASIDVTYSAAAASISSISDVDPVISTTKNVTLTPAALTGDISAPTPVFFGGHDNTFTASAILGSVDVTAPGGVGGARKASLSYHVNRVESGTPGSVIDETANSTGRIYTTGTVYLMKPDLSVLPYDADIVKAEWVTFYTAPASGGFRFESIDGAFTSSVTYATMPSMGASQWDFTSGGTTGTTGKFDLTDIVERIHAGTSTGFAVAYRPGSTLSSGGVTPVWNDFSLPASGSSGFLVITYWSSGNIIQTAVPFTVDVTAPTPTLYLNFGITFNAPALTGDVSAPDASATTTGSGVVLAEAVEIDIDVPQPFVGSPNVTVMPEPAEVILLVPNGTEAIGGADITVVADVFSNITVEVNEMTFSNDTDIIFTPAPVQVNVRMVGIYNRSEDRYLTWVDTRQTGQADEMWDNVAVKANPGGVVFGSPVTDVLTDTLRRGYSFDGIDDYIDNPDFPKTVRSNAFGSYGNFWNYEIIYKTTATSGVFYSNVAGNTALELTSTGLQLTMRYGSQATDVYHFPIPNAKVNDGNWHRLFVVNYNPLTGNAADNYMYIMLDSDIIWRRWNIADQGAPEVLGKRATGTANYLRADIVTQNLYGGLSAYGTSDEDSVRTGYYEYLEATIVHGGTPCQVDISAPSNTLARGNTKKMLVLYGNSESRNSNLTKYNAYASSWSGMRMKDSYDEGTNLFGQTNPIKATETFDWKGFKCYPVHMWRRDYSAQGVVKQLNIGPHTGQQDDFYFIDDVTGEPQFINLQRDLAVNLLEFDAIHVLHWPDPNLDSEFPASSYGTEDPPFFNSLTEVRYDEMRESLKNSIRAAVDEGLGLFIAEAQQAVEFGIATGFDMHAKPYEGSSEQNASGGAIAEKRDFEIRNTSGGPWDGYTPEGWYEDSYTVSKRRIVSTAGGFSETPTWWVPEWVFFHKFDRLTSYADQYRQMVAELPDGLTIGSEFTMITGNFHSGGTNVEERPRETVVSLRPNGLVGQVIAKEQAQYYRGVDLVDNPYKDNAVTVLIDSGTMLEGAPVGGRIWVELMDNDFNPLPYRNTAAGIALSVSEGAPASDWSFDTRRDKEIFYWSSYQTLRQNIIVVSEEQGLVNTTQRPAEFLPYVSMLDRGAAWLAAGPEVTEVGSKKVYATAANVLVDASGASGNAEKNTVFQANALQVFVQVVKPTSIEDPDVTVYATPAYVSIIMTGRAANYVAEPASVTITSGDHSVQGAGADLVFSMRTGRDITLYVGEEE